MFIQPCFIRKNTLELRKKLEELGYEYYTPNGIKSDNIVVSLGCIFDICSIDTIKRGFNNCIDCGTNEELFLALAALREDTDKNQYCIDSEGNWFLYNKIYVRLLSKINVNYHKATVEEIIEHFK